MKKQSRHPKRGAPTKRVSPRQYAAAKALSAFRPRKKEARSFVFISAKGKRISPKQGRKGLYVYVYKGRDGKVHSRPVKPYRKPVELHRASTFDLESTRLKTALAKQGRKQKPTFTSRTEVLKQSRTAKEKRQGVEFRRFSDRLATDLKTTIQSFRSRGHFQIDVSFTVKLPSGKLETYNETIGFSQAEKQVIDKRGYKDFILTKLYRQLAANLSSHGLVSSGSSAHIRSLAQNRGMPRSDWVDRRGELWEKADYQTAKIIRMEYTIKRISK